MSVWVRVALGVGTAALIVAILAVRRVLVLADAVTQLSREVTELRAQTRALSSETQAALRDFAGDSRKADALLDAAASLASTADAASQLAYRAVTNPLVKVLAWSAGGKRAVGRFLRTPTKSVDGDAPIYQPRTPAKRSSRSKH